MAYGLIFLAATLLFLPLTVLWVYSATDGSMRMNGGRGPSYIYEVRSPPHLPRTIMAHTLGALATACLRPWRLCTALQALPRALPV